MRSGRQAASRENNTWGPHGFDLPFCFLFSSFSLWFWFFWMCLLFRSKRVFCGWDQVCLLQLIVGVQGSGKSYFESLFCSPCRIYSKHGVWSLWAFVFVSGKWRWYFLSWRTGVQIWAHRYKVYVNQILCSAPVCTLPCSDHRHPASPFLYSQWSASLIRYLIKLFVRGVAHVPGRQRSLFVWVAFSECKSSAWPVGGAGWVLGDEIGP